MAAQRLVALLPQAHDWAGVRVGRDLSAGVMVALVAMPLALGFGVSTGMGAEAGLVTAIIAGMAAAVFGGSQLQVTGPTGAMTVVLIPIVTTYGTDGVLTVGLMAGVMLVALALARAGRAMRYVPVSVVEGFTVGIAVVIGLQQLPLALGVDAHAEKVLTLASTAARAWSHRVDVASPAVAFGGAAVVLLASRLRPGMPAALLLVVAATVANADLGWNLATIGTLPAGLPGAHLPTIPWHELDSLVLPALAVATVAALESLLSAGVADAMTVGHRHDPDRELFGQGVANIVTPLFGGIPATAALARTAVNVRAGATSRLAALTHAAVLLLVVVALSRWVSLIPLPALAAVLIATAVQMVRVSSVRALASATRGDAATLAITFVATVCLDLVLAVVLGLVVAGFFALRETAQSAALAETPLDDADHGAEEHALLDEHIVAYRIDGPLFFAAAHDFLLELATESRVRVVILRMGHVTTIDATGAHVLADTVGRLERRGVTVLLSGVRPAHRQVLDRLGVYGRLAHERHVFDSTPEAITHARTHAARIAHAPGGAA